MELSESVKKNIISKELAIFEIKQNLEVTKHEMEMEINKSEKKIICHIRNITSLHFNNISIKNASDLYSSCSIILEFLRQMFFIIDQHKLNYMKVRRCFNYEGCKETLNKIKPELQSVQNGKRTLNYEVIHSLCSISDALSSNIYLILRDKEIKEFFFGNIFNNLEKPEDLIPEENDNNLEKPEDLIPEENEIKIKENKNASR